MRLADTNFIQTAAGTSQPGSCGLLSHQRYQPGGTEQMFLGATMSFGLMPSRLAEQDTGQILSRPGITGGFASLRGSAGGTDKVKLLTVGDGRAGMITYTVGGSGSGSSGSLDARVPSWMLGARPVCSAQPDQQQRRHTAPGKPEAETEGGGPQPPLLAYRLTATSVARGNAEHCRRNVSPGAPLFYTARGDEAIGVAQLNTYISKYLDIPLRWPHSPVLPVRANSRGKNPLEQGCGSDASADSATSKMRGEASNRGEPTRIGWPSGAYRSTVRQAPKY